MNIHSTPRQISAVLAGIALVALAVIAWSLSQSPDIAPGLPTRTVQAGAVEVTLTPQTLDASGAVFQVELDTHTATLDVDMTSSARLSVNGVDEDAARWDGQGPGGHHREGTLSFAAPVPAGARVELRLGGLPGDATARWSAP